MKLERTRQCLKCPWRVDVDPRGIPRGYRIELHRALAETIAAPGDTTALADDASPPAMACHESPPSRETHCVGWLVNQLGVGNNLALRMTMLRYENANELQTIGEQHERFEDTLPSGEPA